MLSKERPRSSTTSAMVRWMSEALGMKGGGGMGLAGGMGMPLVCGAGLGGFAASSPPVAMIGRRILHVCDSLQMGGAERVLIGLAAGLVDRGARGTLAYFDVG